MTKKICNDVVRNMYKSITGCVISYQDIYCGNSIENRQECQFSSTRLTNQGT